VERRGDQESQGDPSRASNGSEFSQPSGPASMSYDSAPVLEDEPPSAKRSRNTRIRYDINSYAFFLFFKFFLTLEGPGCDIPSVVIASHFQLLRLQSVKPLKEKGFMG